MTIRRMGIACWIPKATGKHSEYVILTAFPLQQWLHERASLLRYTHIDCLVASIKVTNLFCCLFQAQSFYFQNIAAISFRKCLLVLLLK